VNACMPLDVIIAIETDGPRLHGNSIAARIYYGPDAPPDAGRLHHLWHFARLYAE
jgi:hypothetical protein